MNFTLKLDKFNGGSNDDAHSWLLQFAQYCSCYDLDDETKTIYIQFTSKTMPKFGTIHCPKIFGPIGTICLAVFLNVLLKIGTH